VVWKSCSECFEPLNGLKNCCLFCTGRSIRNDQFSVVREVVIIFIFVLYFTDEHESINGGNISLCVVVNIYSLQT